MQKKSGFTTLIILTLVVLALLTGGYWYWQQNKLPTASTPTPTPILSPIPPTPAPTANPKLTDVSTWKTYTDRNLGYSIKYPGDWYNFPLSATKYSRGGVSFTYSGNKETVVSPPGVGVSVQTDPRPYFFPETWPDAKSFFDDFYNWQVGRTEKIKTYWVNFDQALTRDTMQVKKIANLEIDSYPAVYLQITMPDSLTNWAFTSEHYIILKDNELFWVSNRITTANLPTSRKPYAEIAKQIMGTFQFLN